jgi:myosin heavy chain 9/10/11/14
MELTTARNGELSKYALLSGILPLHPRLFIPLPQRALNVVGFSKEEQFNLFRILAAILHISNVPITQDRDQQAHIRDPSQLEKAAHLLGVRVSDLSRALRQPRVRAGKEIVSQARNMAQVTAEMASLCRTLYEKNFGALVETINRALDRSNYDSTFIGVLDIAGFEIFEQNSFEQVNDHSSAPVGMSQRAKVFLTALHQLHE